ncbi:methyltransferase [Actibacterium sp. 188UL27-1]|uniref:methyltransferase n=1 Tax=Actibacterium sp. 188UL27-1 TaxID=2786961 RepID=UPI001EF6886D|nr:methyltransferase [Actibacterium sp. 188UL27-1]
MPTGHVLAIGARSQTNLSFAPDATIVAGFKPDFAAWSARGRDTLATIKGPADGAIVFLPRAKAQARDWIARALALGGPVIIDGDKTDGIDSILKAVRAVTATSAPFAKAHGKVFRIEPTDALAHWIQPDLVQTGDWMTAPGAFSADGPDPASTALADAMPDLAGRIADLGAAWGYLSARVLASPKVTECDLIEADHGALHAARANVTDIRAAFHWADALAWQADPYAHIISNPPFHTDRRADPSLGTAFITASARLLTPSGTLWLVANRHLPYERALKEAFAEVTELPGPPAFKLIRARKPVRRRR